MLHKDSSPLSAVRQDVYQWQALSVYEQRTVLSRALAHLEPKSRYTQKWQITRVSLVPDMRVSNDTPASCEIVARQQLVVHLTVG